MPASLSADQIREYSEQGYLLLRGLFGPEELRRFADRLSALLSGSTEAPRGMLVMRDVMVAKGAVDPGSREEAVAKVQDFEHDAVLFPEYARSDKLLDRIQALIGPDIKSVHTMLINKPPNVDGRHPLHQDLLYFPFRPADSIVASWTAIDRCTRQNGCLVVVPRSHRGGLLEHGNPDWEWLNLAYFGAKGVGPETDRVHLEMEPGDTVLFHPLLLHGSGQNRTSGFRRSISAHFASARCTYVADEQIVERGSRPYRLVRGQEYPEGI